MGDKITALRQGSGDVLREAQRDESVIAVAAQSAAQHESVAIGKTAEDNPLVRTWGEKAAFGFKAKSHVELCESLKLVDFVRGAKLSGSGFLLYTNWGAKLERALIQFLLDLHTAELPAILERVSPPYLVSKDFPHDRRGASFLKFIDQAYTGAGRRGQTRRWENFICCRDGGSAKVANIHREGNFGGATVAGLLLRLTARVSGRKAASACGREHARDDPRASIRTRWN